MLKAKKVDNKIKISRTGNRVLVKHETKVDDKSCFCCLFNKHYIVLSNKYLRTRVTFNICAAILYATIICAVLFYEANVCAVILYKTNICAEMLFATIICAVMFYETNIRAQVFCTPKNCAEMFHGRNICVQFFFFGDSLWRIYNRKYI